MKQLFQQNIQDLDDLIKTVCSDPAHPKCHPQYNELIKKFNLYNQIGAAFIVEYEAEESKNFEIQWASLGKEKNLRDSLKKSDLQFTPIEVRTRTLWDVHFYERLKTLRSMNEMTGLMRTIVESYKQREPKKEIIMVSAGITDNDFRKKPENLDILNDLVWLFTDLGYVVFDTLPFDQLISDWFVLGKIESTQHLMWSFYHPFFKDGTIKKVYAESLWPKSNGATFEHSFANEFGIPHYTLPENFHRLSVEDARVKLSFLSETKDVKTAAS